MPTNRELTGIKVLHFVGNREMDGMVKLMAMTYPAVMLHVQNLKYWKSRS